MNKEELKSPKHMLIAEAMHNFESEVYQQLKPFKEQMNPKVLETWISEILI